MSSHNTELQSTQKAFRTTAVASLIPEIVVFDHGKIRFEVSRWFHAKNVAEQPWKASSGKHRQIGREAHSIAFSIHSFTFSIHSFTFLHTTFFTHRRLVLA